MIVDMNMSESVPPFSRELLSNQTLSEIKEMSSLHTSQSYNPNEDGGASELGGDVCEVPLGSGLMPFAFVAMVYALRTLLKAKNCSRLH